MFFTELDAGKVVVICWVMPCGGCIGAASTDASTVSAMANPKVVFYLMDDVGNTSCSTLSSWASTNSINTTATFGNSGNAVKMSDYGSSGMPKTIVVGGASHTVYYNVNGTVSQSSLQTAINNALAATGINENNALNAGLNVFPNPVSTTAKVTYTLKNSADISIEIMNELGQKASTVSLGKQSAGKQEYQINLGSLDAGIYFIKLNADQASEITKLTVTK